MSRGFTVEIFRLRLKMTVAVRFFALRLKMTEIGQKLTVENKKSAVSKNSGFVLQINTNNGTCRCKVGFAPDRVGLPVAARDRRGRRICLSILI
ncbi:MAG: hypothetical protein J6M05_05690 [Cardiobacteriaceae bacterium]|nr:hypothetical protein [Cardiobacteriaceae bacterium]